jgi:hypothetical protein
VTILCGKKKYSSVTEYFVLTGPKAQQHLKRHYVNLNNLEFEAKANKYTAKTKILISGEKFAKTSAAEPTKNSAVFS